jgi:hypothetical protein
MRACGGHCGVSSEHQHQRRRLSVHLQKHALRTPRCSPSRATVINWSTGFPQFCGSRLVTLGYESGLRAHECQRDDQQDAAMQRPWW